MPVVACEITSQPAELRSPASPTEASSTSRTPPSAAALSPLSPAGSTAAAPAQQPVAAAAAAAASSKQQAAAAVAAAASSRASREQQQSGGRGCREQDARAEQAGIGSRATGRHSARRDQVRVVRPCGPGECVARAVSLRTWPVLVSRGCRQCGRRLRWRRRKEVVAHRAAPASGAARSGTTRSPVRGAASARQARSTRRDSRGTRG